MREDGKGPWARSFRASLSRRTDAAQAQFHVDNLDVSAIRARLGALISPRRSAKQFAAVNVDQAPETPGWGPTGASQPATANSPRMRWGTARRASSTRALDARLTASSSRSTHGLAAWLARLRAGEVQQPTAHAVMETPGPSLLTSGSPTPHLRDIDPIASHARPSPTVSIVKATSSSTVTVAHVSAAEPPPTDRDRLPVMAREGQGQAGNASRTLSAGGATPLAPSAGPRQFPVPQPPLASRPYSPTRYQDRATTASGDRSRPASVSRAASGELSTALAALRVVGSPAVCPTSPHAVHSAHSGASLRRGLSTAPMGTWSAHGSLPDGSSPGDWRDGGAAANDALQARTSRRRLFNQSGRSADAARLSRSTSARVSNGAQGGATASARGGRVGPASLGGPRFAGDAVDVAGKGTGKEAARMAASSGGWREGGGALGAPTAEWSGLACTDIDGDVDLAAYPLGGDDAAPSPVADAVPASPPPGLTINDTGDDGGDGAGVDSTGVGEDLFPGVIEEAATKASAPKRAPRRGRSKKVKRGGSKRVKGTDAGGAGQAEASLLGLGAPPVGAPPVADGLPETLADRGAGHMASADGAAAVTPRHEAEGGALLAGDVGEPAGAHCVDAGGTSGGTPLKAERARRRAPRERAEAGGKDPASPRVLLGRARSRRAAAEAAAKAAAGKAVAAAVAVGPPGSDEDRIRTLRGSSDSMGSVVNAGMLGDGDVAVEEGGDRGGVDGGRGCEGTAAAAVMEVAAGKERPKRVGSRPRDHKRASASGASEAVPPGSANHAAAATARAPGPHSAPRRAANMVSKAPVAEAEQGPEPGGGRSASGAVAPDADSRGPDEITELELKTALAASPLAARVAAAYADAAAASSGPPSPVKILASPAPAEKRGAGVNVEAMVAAAAARVQRRSREQRAGAALERQRLAEARSKARESASRWRAEKERRRAVTYAVNALLTLVENRGAERFLATVETWRRMGLVPGEVPESEQGSDGERGEGNGHANAV